jgi:transcriptional regulator with XRE-family HTH domain
LAVDVRFSATTISRFESGKSRPSAPVVSEIRFILEAAGIEFIAEQGSDPGVKLRQPE